MEVGVAGIMVIMEDITTTSLAHVPLIMEEEKLNDFNSKFKSENSAPLTAHYYQINAH